MVEEKADYAFHTNSYSNHYKSKIPQNHPYNINHSYKLEQQ